MKDAKRFKMLYCPNERLKPMFEGSSGPGLPKTSKTMVQTVVSEIEQHSPGPYKSCMFLFSLEWIPDSSTPGLVFELVTAHLNSLFSLS